VGIREIASAAGVSHGLVQRYCGTREQMIAKGRPTPAMRLARAIRSLQAQTPAKHPPLDPVLLSA
jgi:AcrR family transcriptional regulator